MTQESVQADPMTRGSTGSRIRGPLTVLGSLLALFGYLFKITYSVTYSPPMQSSFARIDVGKLRGFASGSLDPESPPGGQLLWFNGHSGPLHLGVSLVAVLAMLAIGLVASSANIGAVQGTVSHIVSLTGHTVALLSTVLGLGSLIWAFRNGQTPAAITHRFIADLGGGPYAVHAARFLSADIEVGALFLFFGLVIAGAAVNLRRGGIVTGCIKLARGLAALDLHGWWNDVADRARSTGLLSVLLSDILQVLPSIELRRSYRIACMVVGGLLVVLGLALPWYLVTFSPPGGQLLVSDVTHRQSLDFVSMFNFSNINISQGWVTLEPYNPVLHTGLLAIELAAALTFGLALATALETRTARVRVNVTVAVVGRLVIALILLAAILEFLKLIWWSLVDHNFQQSIRAAVYQTFDGGHVGATVAAFCYSWPYVGFFVTVAGLGLSAVGVYTRSPKVTTSLSPEDRRRMWHLVRNGAIGAVLLTGGAALVLWWLAIRHQAV